MNPENASNFPGSPTNNPQPIVPNASQSKNNNHYFNLNLNAKSFTVPKQYKKIQMSPASPKYQANNLKITEVYEDNFVKEITRIGKYLKQYPYIGMDTEFPGIVYKCPMASHDFYYQFTKVNVDKLKLIQLGITLTNEKGEYPPNAGTWQFNFKFDIDNDENCKDSINMLINSGIDFSVIKSKGINHTLFAEYFIVSGLVLNEDVTWICFNGLSDFAYLLALVTNQLLPQNEVDFQKLLEIYFPNIYDIKYLINDIDTYKGGLNKLAKDLNVERTGEIHQAGSDSQVTSEVFFRLIKNNIINHDIIGGEKNVIYGIGPGADDLETFGYTSFDKGVDVNGLLQNINIGFRSPGNFNTKQQFNYY